MSRARPGVEIRWRLPLLAAGGLGLLGEGAINERAEDGAEWRER